jgi:hypothetical protein
MSSLQSHSKNVTSLQSCVRKYEGEPDPVRDALLCRAAHKATKCDLIFNKQQIETEIMENSENGVFSLVAFTYQIFHVFPRRNTCFDHITPLLRLLCSVTHKSLYVVQKNC